MSVGARREDRRKEPETKMYPTRMAGVVDSSMKIL